MLKSMTGRKLEVAVAVALTLAALIILTVRWTGAGDPIASASDSSTVVQHKQ